MQSIGIFRTVVLDDSEFYNNLITRHLRLYAERLSATTVVPIEVMGYTSPRDFLQNLGGDLRLAFIDYSLGNGVTGEMILSRVREKVPDCKVILISGIPGEMVPFRSLILGADGFVPKNEHTPDTLSLIMEKTLRENLSLPM